VTHEPLGYPARHSGHRTRQLADIHLGLSRIGFRRICDKPALAPPEYDQKRAERCWSGSAGWIGVTASGTLQLERPRVPGSQDAKLLTPLAKVEVGVRPSAFWRPVWIGRHPIFHQWKYWRGLVAAAEVRTVQNNEMQAETLHTKGSSIAMATRNS
jgi:hypothetical protein